MNILKFKTNRTQDAYKIALNIKKSIDQWTKQTYLISILKELSLITKIPPDIISYEIKQILSSNFKFTAGIFTKRLLLRYVLLDAATYLFLLVFSIIFSKSSFKSKEYKIIIDDIEQEDQAERFSEISKLTKNSVFICKKNILFKKSNLKKFNIKTNSIFKFYNNKFLYGKRLKFFIIFFPIFFQSIRHNVNLFFIFSKLFYKIIDNETLFSQVKSKILITDRFYRTSSIKNYIFKKKGGAVASCIQKNICEFSISFFINVDIFFSLGNSYPLIIRKLGGRINKFVPTGSLFMEHMWYNEKKDLKNVPKSDVLVIGTNHGKAAHRLYIDKYHCNNYYQHFEWLKKISLKYPRLNIISKHHGNCPVDRREQKILENTNVKTIYKSPSVNFSYSYIYKAKQIFSFASTMILECVSMDKNSYFLDPNLQNIAFHKSIPKAKIMRIKSYKEFEKKITSNLKKNKMIKIENPNSLCLKSDKVSKRIVNFFKRENYLV